MLDETLEAASPPSEHDAPPPTPDSVVDDVRYARWLWRQVLAQFLALLVPKVQILTHRARQTTYSPSMEMTEEEVYELRTGMRTCADVC